MTARSYSGSQLLRSIPSFRWILVEMLLQALGEAKKDPGDFTIGKRVYIAVDKDHERAAKRTREWFGQYYGRAELANRVAVWGSSEGCGVKLREIVAAGARLLVLNPMFDKMDHLEILAREIIPQVIG